jgi:prophage antirepressor-like protein
MTTQHRRLPTSFDYHGHDIRTVTDENGDVWFVTVDACKVLGHPNVSQVVSRLDEDEKLTSTLWMAGQHREVVLVSEPGLYELMFTSRKQEAKAFKRWVKHEVLPALRKTGRSAMRQQLPTLREQLYDRLSAHEQYIPAGYFTPSSVAAKHLPALVEMFDGLDASAMPEHSIAQRFARYAKEDLHIPDEHRRRYPHALANGRVVQVWAYDRQYLPLFVQWLWDVYFPQHFPDYERYRARYIGLPAPTTRKYLASPKGRSQAIQPPLWG